MLIPFTIETTTAEGQYDMSSDILNAQTIILMNAKVITKPAYTYNSVSFDLANTMSNNIIDSDPQNFYLKHSLNYKLNAAGDNVSDSIATIAYESIGPISKNLRFVIRSPTGAPLTALELTYAFVQFQIVTKDSPPIQVSTVMHSAIQSRIGNNYKTMDQ